MVPRSCPNIGIALAVNAAFAVRVPDDRRAQAFGLANAGVIVGQGLGFVLTWA